MNDERVMAIPGFGGAVDALDAARLQVDLPQA